MKLKGELKPEFLLNRICVDLEIKVLSAIKAPKSTLERFLFQIVFFVISKRIYFS